MLCSDLPRVWLCNTGAILQASIPVYPQEHIGRQLQDLAVKLADVRQYFEPFDVMSCFCQSLVVQHPDDLHCKLYPKFVQHTPWQLGCGLILPKVPAGVGRALRPLHHHCQGHALL